MNDTFGDIEKLPKTAVMESRVDMRSLASITRYLIKKGYNPSTKSSLIRVGIESFAVILKSNDLDKGFDSTHEALQFMNNVGYVFGRLGDKGNKELVIQLQAESIGDSFNDSEVQQTAKELLDSAK